MLTISFAFIPRMIEKASISPAPKIEGRKGAEKGRRWVAVPGDLWGHFWHFLTLLPKVAAAAAKLLQSLGAAKKDSCRCHLSTLARRGSWWSWTNFSCERASVCLKFPITPALQSCLECLMHQHLWQAEPSIQPIGKPFSCSCSLCNLSSPHQKPRAFSALFLPIKNILMIWPRTHSAPWSGKENNIFKNSLFIYCFWLCWIFVAACWLSLIAETQGYSSWWTWASHCSGFSCCRAQAPG